jgi:hypothetical protein
MDGQKEAIPWALVFQLLPIVFVVIVVASAYYCYAQHISLEEEQQEQDSCPEYPMTLPRYVTQERIQMPPLYEDVMPEENISHSHLTTQPNASSDSQEIPMQQIASPEPIYTQRV